MGVTAGTELPTRVFRVTRADLVRYAGASGDFNAIHWSRRAALAAGLPDVIAHGMYTMALAGRLLTDWTGDPAAVVDYTVRFTKPVVVPDDDDGAEVTVSGLIRKVNPDGTVLVDLKAVSGGEKVLGRAQATVRPPT